MSDIFQIQGKDTVVQLGSFPAVNAMQNFNWDPRFNEESLMELGNEGYSAKTTSPEVNASFEMTATGATVAMLRRMIVKKNATTNEFEGYKGGLPGDANPNTGTIRTKDLEGAIVDLIEKKKANEIFSRATLIPRAHLSQLSFRVDSNGKATESYTFEGDVVRIFPTGKHDLFSVPLTRTGASSTALAIADPAFIDAANTGSSSLYVVHSLMVDEQIVPTGGFTAPGTTGVVTLTGANTAPLGSRTVAFLYKRVPGTFPTLVAPTAARFVKAYQADIYLVPKSTVDVYAMSDGALNSYAFLSSDRVLRAQSMDLSVDLRREALRQIANNTLGTSIYYRAATYPFNITSNVSVTETDMADHAKLEGLNAATDVLDLAGFDGKEWQIVVRYFYNGAAIQTMAVCDMTVTGSGRRVSAGGRAEISWAFSGSKIVIEGV